MSIYSGESKYKISVKQSTLALRLQHLLPWGIAALSVSILAVESIVVSSLLFLLVLFFVIYWQKRSHEVFKKNVPFADFSIDSQGYCYFTKVVNEGTEIQYQTLKISTRSRVAFIGCWLYFENNSQHFFFRDSLSRQDFSRLARVIYSLAVIKDPQNQSKQS